MKYEYNAVPLGHESAEHALQLDALGAEGWELVSVDNGVAYFKRAIAHAECTPCSFEDADAESYINSHSRDLKPIGLNFKWTPNAMHGYPVEIQANLPPTQSIAPDTLPEYHRQAADVIRAVVSNAAADEYLNLSRT